MFQLKYTLQTSKHFKNTIKTKGARLLRKFACLQRNRSIAASAKTNLFPISYTDNINSLYAPC